MDGKLLKSVMVKNGDTQKKLAQALDLQQSAMCLRIAGKIEFRMNEANMIRKRYNLTDEETVQIFFNNKVS